MRLVYSNEAVKSIVEIQDWWLEHRRKNPWLFSDELAAAERHILSGPHRPPVFREIDGKVSRALRNGLPPLAILRLRIGVS